jgi:hypothetical protein
MKDCTTFLKLQEAALNKQTEARQQGFEGNNNPLANQQGNNGATQGQDQQNKGHDNDEGYIPSKGHITSMIQPVPKSNKEEKSITRQVNLAVISPPATTEYLHWSEQPIEFNREDHPIIVPRLGNAPLVLKAQIGTTEVKNRRQGGSTYFQRQSTWCEDALTRLALAEHAPCWHQLKLFQLSSPCQAQFFATSQRLL